MPTVREMFQNMTVSSPGGAQRRGAPLQMMGTEVGSEKSPSADGRGRPGRVCGVTERPGSSIRLFVRLLFQISKTKKPLKDPTAILSDFSHKRV